MGKLSEDELAKLKRASNEQAKKDQQQCMLMFQQLARLNASLIERCEGYGSDEARRQEANANVQNIVQPPAVPQQTTTKPTSADGHDETRSHLQTLVVQQAHELEDMRKRLDCAIPIPPGCQVVSSNLTLPSANADAPMLQPIDANAMDNDVDVSPTAMSRANRHAAHLRTLPLTSLHARLKTKDFEIQKLQSLAAKLETQLSRLVDKKREMARDYQQITTVQQTQLKKYFAYLQQLGKDKKRLESSLKDMQRCISVLEKKLVDATRPYAQQKDASVWRGSIKAEASGAQGHYGCSASPFLVQSNSISRRTSHCNRDTRAV
ncbi:hypothetical protein FI667_g7793, partial [Globisporangium splendens]